MPTPVTYGTYKLSRLISVEAIVSADYIFGTHVARNPHIHKEAWEFLFCIDNVMHVMDGETSVTLKKGEAYFVRPGTVHDVLVNSDDSRIFVVSFTCSGGNLLDPETITQDSNTWANKVNNGDVGAFNYLRLINTALTPETAANYTAILPPVAEGCKVAVPMVMELPSAGAYLTSTNKDPVASLKWLDAQLETENMFVAQNGKMGEQLKVNDSGLYEVISVPENNGLYDFVPVSMGQFFGPGDYMTSNYQMAPHRIERYEDSKAYAEAGVLEAKSFWYLTTLSKMNNDDSVEAANICTEIRKFMDESMVDFIKNGVTDESFATFQNNAKSLQVERYVALYQAAYDAYLAK